MVLGMRGNKVNESVANLAAAIIVSRCLALSDDNAALGADDTKQVPALADPPWPR